MPGSRWAREVAGLPTAVSASYGSGELVIGLFAEYDALPGIGHACGHNIIAAAAVTAGLAARPGGRRPRHHGQGVRHARRGERRRQGRHAEDGAFDGLHAAMMVHPAPMDMVGAGSHRRQPPHRRVHRPDRARQRASRSSAVTPPTPSRSRRPPSACCASTCRRRPGARDHHRRRRGAERRTRSHGRRLRYIRGESGEQVHGGERPHRALLPGRGAGHRVRAVDTA